MLYLNSHKLVDFVTITEPSLFKGVLTTITPGSIRVLMRMDQLWKPTICSWNQNWRGKASRTSEIMWNQQIERLGERNAGCFQWNCQMKWWTMHFLHAMGCKGGAWPCCLHFNQPTANNSYQHISTGRLESEFNDFFTRGRGQVTMVNQPGDTALPEGSFPIEVPAGVVPGQQLTVSLGWSSQCQRPPLFWRYT